MEEELVEKIDLVVGDTVGLEVDAVVDEDVSDEMVAARAITITITTAIPIRVILPIPTRSLFSRLMLSRSGSDCI